MAAEVGAQGFVTQQHLILSRPDSRPDLPRILYRVVLISPQGLGTIELRQEPEAQGRGEVPVYRAYGGILVSDDVARWRFTYIKTSLEGPGAAPGEWVDGLQAVSVFLANATRGDLEIDWERSAFVDSQVAADKFGTIRLSGVSTDNAGAAFGLKFHTDRGSVRLAAAGPGTLPDHMTRRRHGRWGSG